MIQPINNFSNASRNVYFKHDSNKYEEMYRMYANSGSDYKKYYARYKSKEYAPMTKQIDAASEYLKSFKGIWGRRLFQLILSCGITEALIVGFVVANTTRVNNERLQNKKYLDNYVKIFNKKVANENVEQAKINFEEQNIRNKFPKKEEADEMIKQAAFKRLKSNYSRHEELPMNTFRDLQKHFGLKPLETNTPTEEQARAACSDIKEMLVLSIAEKFTEKKSKKELEELYNIAYELANNDKSTNYEDDVREANVLKEAMELSTDIKFNSLTNRQINALINFTREFQLYTEKMLIQALYAAGRELCALSDLPAKAFECQLYGNEFMKIV